MPTEISHVDVQVKLTRRERITLVAKFCEGHIRPNRELAERFGVSAKAISKRVCRALGKLGISPFHRVRVYANLLGKRGQRVRIKPMSLSLVTI